MKPSNIFNFIISHLKYALITLTIAIFFIGCADIETLNFNFPIDDTTPGEDITDDTDSDGTGNDDTTETPDNDNDNDDDDDDDDNTAGQTDPNGGAAGTEDPDDDGDTIPNDIDVDLDNDGLIDIYTLEQLNNIRYNLAGTSYVDADLLESTHGAPTAATPNCTTPTNGIYLCGYELMNDLDFDTNGNGYTFHISITATATSTGFSTIITAIPDMEDAYYNEGDGWNPIGSCTINDSSCETAFTGIFEGNGNTISNLFIKNNTYVPGNSIGLFDTVSHRIQNVHLENSYVENAVLAAAEINLGSLAGSAEDAAILNSSAQGTVKGGYGERFAPENTGGLIGRAATGTIISSSFTGSVFGGSITGGLVGFGGTIINSYAAGNSEDIVNGFYAVGGLAGSTSGTITASYAAINVKTSDSIVPDSAGGLVGTPRGNVVASYATGNVYGSDGNQDNIGGLVGYQTYVNIIASYATGTTHGNDGDSDAVGGLVGQSSYSEIAASYATGDANGGAGHFDHVGGLVGSPIGIDLMASYATGDAYGGSGDNDYVGGLLGTSSYSDIAASYATGNTSGGTGARDYAGTLIGAKNWGTITASYAFGTITDTDNDGISPTLPTDVVSIHDLTAETAGSCSTTADPLTQTECLALNGTWTTWNAHSGGIDAWDFGNTTHAPALRFADYDGTNSGIDYCGTTIPSELIDGTTITCGTNGRLIPGQGR